MLKNCYSNIFGKFFVIWISSGMSKNYECHTLVPLSGEQYSSSPCFSDDFLYFCQNGTLQLSGIVSWGVIPCAQSSFPSVYTNVGYFRWENKNYKQGITIIAATKHTLASHIKALKKYFTIWLFFPFSGIGLTSIWHSEMLEWMKINPMVFFCVWDIETV